jgi:N-acetylneuraminic acid mutarotase
LVDDVWSSSDGTNWTQVASAAPWSSRTGHAVVVLDGQMWVLGGSDFSSYFKDVWSSQNGTTNSVPVQLGQFYLFQKQ